jgi:hypothetical protein
MPISTDTLRSASSRLSKSVTLSEARRLGLRTAFLCHSHRDADLVQGLANLLGEEGLNVYIDWADISMPEQPTRETAKRIQSKILESAFFLFLATSNSMSSRWCPWEIGYADGKKPINTILILPTSDRSGNWHGNEYLQLYRSIDFSTSGRLGVWEAGQTRGAIGLRDL